MRSQARRITAVVLAVLTAPLLAASCAGGSDPYEDIAVRNIQVATPEEAVRVQYDAVVEGDCGKAYAVLSLRLRRIFGNKANACAFFDTLAPRYRSSDLAVAVISAEEKKVQLAASRVAGDETLADATVDLVFEEDTWRVDKLGRDEA